MKSERNSAYKESGVDVEAGYEAVRLIREHVNRTKTAGVLGDLGGFGGLYELPNGSVLAAGTDGVGTKLKVAFTMGKNDTVGVDCVAMCVNDVICCGAKPIFFLDYVAVGRNVPERVAEIVSGVAEGCVQAGCALIGGETAEMPGFYAENEYDLAGFCVGIAERDEILRVENVSKGNAVVAIPSSGVHSNGFSLVRRIFADYELRSHYDEFGKTLGEELLTPTRIYVRDVLPVTKKVKSIAHITGGGFYENIPRAIPKGLKARINQSAIKVPAIFDVIMKTGGISVDEMYHVFNMGVGMVLVTDCADEVLRAVEGSYVIGEIVEGEGIELC